MKGYGFANQAFRFGKYLRSRVESNNHDAYELIELRNKIVHQRYAATEMETCGFLHLVEMDILICYNSESQKYKGAFRWS